MTQHFWLPTRPYNLIAAINRYGAATGSMRGAMLSAGADYNGHAVGFVEPNKFKTYWTCYYTWAGINTIGRGSLGDCLRAARQEYDRGALGATARVKVATEEDARACLDAGFQPWSKEIEAAHDATWRTPMHKLVSDAFRMQEFLPGAVSVLANSETAEEYESKIKAMSEERRAAYRR
jgi:hypothetical protein